LAAGEAFATDMAADFVVGGAAVLDIAVILPLSD
jgi:hypothetical protein